MVQQQCAASWTWNSTLRMWNVSSFQGTARKIPWFAPLPPPPAPPTRWCKEAWRLPRSVAVNREVKLGEKDVIRCDDLGAVRLHEPSALRSRPRLKVKVVCACYEYRQGYPTFCRRIIGLLFLRRRLAVFSKPRSIPQGVQTKWKL